MKRLLLLALFFPIFCFAQSAKDSIKWLKDTIPLAHLPIDTTGNIVYRLVENVPGVTKIELYNRAKVWTAMAFVSAKTVTQLDDKDAGNIVVKAISKQTFDYKFLGVPYPIEYYLHFSIQITVKDAKYRAIMSQFQIEYLPSKYSLGGTFPLEEKYKLLLDWNKNAKSGNMQFNRLYIYGPKEARENFTKINNLDTLAKATLAEIKAALSKPAKADDF
jgi:hypothetical protein